MKMLDPELKENIKAAHSYYMEGVFDIHEYWGVLVELGVMYPC